MPKKKISENALYLREVQAQDADLLFEWANEEACRRNSFSSEPIPYEDHLKWFKETQMRPDVCMFLLMEGQTAVGQIRFSLKEEEAFISYSVNKEKRGNGYGGKILALGEEKMRLIPGIQTLVGEVKRENIPSQRAFEALGYQKTEKENGNQYRKNLSDGGRKK